MTHAQLLALSPLLIVTVTALAVMLSIAVRRHHAQVVGISLSGLALALLATATIWPAATTAQGITDLLVMDRFACFNVGLILIAALATVAFSYGYLARNRGRREELYLLLLLSTLGGLVMVTSRHFSLLFVGLELLSMPLYGMAAYLVSERRSLEAGLKYMLLSAIASAFIVFGMALVYAATGALAFAAVGAQLAALTPHSGTLIPGIALLLIGLAFKLSLAPFHLWTPDVYEGAPAPVTAFLATGSKIAVFALLLRFVLATHATAYPALRDALALLAILSIGIGNVLALQQWNLKRLLAYSAIAHFGYLLVALIASGTLATEAVEIYLATYSVTTLAAFGVITQLSVSLDREAQALSDYRGLFWSHPAAASILALSLLSLAGVPLTAGFLGKFYVLGAGVQSDQWLLLAAVVIGSAVGLFYYLRALIQLFLSPTPAPAPAPLSAAAPATALAPAGMGASIATSGMLLILLVLMLVLGITPAAVIRLAQTADVDTSASTPAALTAARR